MSDSKWYILHAILSLFIVLSECLCHIVENLIACSVLLLAWNTIPLANEKYEIRVVYYNNVEGWPQKFLLQRYSHSIIFVIFAIAALTQIYYLLHRINKWVSGLHWRWKKNIQNHRVIESYLLNTVGLCSVNFFQHQWSLTHKLCDVYLLHICSKTTNNKMLANP